MVSKTTEQLKTWQLQTAKSQFSEVVMQASKGKPQLITKNGKPVVYVISVEEYENMVGARDFKELLLSSPHKEVEILPVRQPDNGRDSTVELSS